jgi:hypothetical protein
MSGPAALSQVRSRRHSQKLANFAISALKISSASLGILCMSRAITEVRLMICAKPVSAKCGVSPEMTVGCSPMSKHGRMSVKIDKCELTVQKQESASWAIRYHFGYNFVYLLGTSGHDYWLNVIKFPRIEVSPDEWARRKKVAMESGQWRMAESENQE